MSFWGAEDSQPANSTLENNPAGGFTTMDQNEQKKAENPKLTSDTSQNTNQNSELRLPDDIMETLKQVESDTHTAFKLTEKLVQNLTVGEQEFIKKLQSAILNNTPIRDFLEDEELPQAA